MLMPIPKLNFLISELKKKGLSKENKLLYLHMLIHIAEDVHLAHAYRSCHRPGRQWF